MSAKRAGVWGEGGVEMGAGGCGLPPPVILSTPPLIALSLLNACRKPIGDA